MIECYPFVAVTAGGMISIPVKGTGQKQVTVSVTGESTGMTARLGVYTFDFTTGSFTAISEDFESAFAAVTPQHTEAAPAATEAPAATREETTAADEKTREPFREFLKKAGSTVANFFGGLFDKSKSTE